MDAYRAAIIGCGRPGQGGFGIAYAHARAYTACPRTTLVAAADINAENLQAFRTTYNVRGYTDYRTLLERERPDIVSICTWPPLHAQMTVEAAEAGVRAIWCEKPMALSLAEADQMLAACAAHGAKLQINHQRRFAPAFQAARELIQSGRLGTLVRLEGYVPEWDLLSWGTHWIDMMRFWNDDRPVAWVIAQVDCRKRTRRYGHLVEDYAVTYFAFENGVRGFLEVGEGCTETVGLRILGTEGMAVIQGGALRARPQGVGEWIEIAAAGSGEQAFLRALEDLIASLEEGRELLLSGYSARATTEIIMAAYESAYRRERVTLPLEVRDFPLSRLVQAQDSSPNRPSDRQV